MNTKDLGEMSVRSNVLPQLLGSTKLHRIVLGNCPLDMISLMKDLHINSDEKIVTQHTVSACEIECRVSNGMEDGLHCCYASDVPVEEVECRELPAC